MNEEIRNETAWARLEAALSANAPVRFWVRDDDAVEVTPALERLERLCADTATPLLLAVIPAGAEPALGRWVADHPLVTACQHGFAHRNHAAPGERACEVGGARDDAVVLDELARGRVAMDAVFGRAGWAPLLVPPWNRMRDSLGPALLGLGFAAVSTFASATPPPTDPPTRLDCDLDIIDWRNGRRGRSVADLCDRLIGMLGPKHETGAPIGLLAHHLAHDPACWTFLERLLPLLARHPGAQLASAPTLLGWPAGARTGPRPQFTV